MPLFALLPDVLRPDPDEARRWLGSELAHPEYHQEDLLHRLMTWLDRLLGGAVQAASGVPVLQLVAALFALVLLLAAILTLASRARREARSRTATLAALPEERMSAAEHLRAATTAHAAREFDTALVEAYRAYVLAYVEAGQVADLPGATASELATQISRLDPALASEVGTLARTFDAVLYGHRPATEQDAARAVQQAGARLGVRR